MNKSDLIRLLAGERCSVQEIALATGNRVDYVRRVLRNGAAEAQRRYRKRSVSTAFAMWLKLN